MPGRPAESPPPAGRPLRADARRNRAKVLAAAREAFTAEGLAVPLDEIARRAGVGAGTVYRHFPTKEALFEAVVTDTLESQAERGRAALGGDGPGEELFAFLAGLVAEAAVKMDLADALAGAGVEPGPGTFEAAGRLREVLGALLERAQRAGAVRGDIGPADLQALIAGAVAAERRAPAGSRPGRLTGVLCDGLRAGRLPG
ncbi:TetR/AcrR family transcriptional regulator [Kitasatospora sp. NPDC018619]|uniref:TetR/AcrR family transcriptional regulator n=1 Tax=unclassified Kitasatospora TaxID=2633591 RepID=UPI003798528D